MITPALLLSFAFVLTYCQDAGDITRLLDARLSKGELTITDILKNTAYMHLHSLAPFRELIKKHAAAGRLTVVTDNEPGERIPVQGTHSAILCK